MFYQCPQCKKDWQYPIEKCPECFLALERIKSERIKVVGISKVAIPTMFHPKVPYFVLVLEDENGNKWVQKSQKEYRIGDGFEEGAISFTDESARRKTVAIWRIKYDALEGIEKAVELIGGPSFFKDIRVGGKILILPTLISAKHPYLAENTSPQFLENTIKYLIERGVKPEDIKIAGQSPAPERSSVSDQSRTETRFLVRGFDEVSLEVCAKKSGLLDVCLKNKVQALDLTKTNFVKKEEGDFTFEISEEVFNSDLIINLPILKIGKTSASENILKFLRKENYLGLKYLHSQEEMVENLNKVLPQYLTLAEAQSVQKSDQFVAHLNLIFSSFNALSLDRVFAEVSMTNKLPELLKKVKIEDIPIIGRKIEEVQYEVEKY